MPKKKQPEEPNAAKIRRIAAKCELHMPPGVCQRRIAFAAPAAAAAAAAAGTTATCAVSFPFGAPDA